MAQLGRHRRDAAAVAGQSARRLEEGNQGHELAPLHHRSRGARPLEGGPDVRDHVPGRGSGLSQSTAALAGFAQGRLDPRQIGRGLEGQGPLAPHGGMRLPGEQALDLGPFDPATAGD